MVVAQSECVHANTFAYNCLHINFTTMKTLIFTLVFSIFCLANAQSIQNAEDEKLRQLYDSLFSNNLAQKYNVQYYRMNRELAEQKEMLANLNETKEAAEILSKNYAQKLASDDITKRNELYRKTLQRLQKGDFQKGIDLLNTSSIYENIIKSRQKGEQNSFRAYCDSYLLKSYLLVCDLQLDSAQLLFENLAAIDSTNFLYLDETAQFYEAKKQYTKAFSAFGKMYSLANTDESKAYTLNNLGECSFLLNKIEEPITYFQNALKMYEDLNSAMTIDNNLLQSNILIRLSELRKKQFSRKSSKIFKEEGILYAKKALKILRRYPPDDEISAQMDKAAMLVTFFEQNQLEEEQKQNTQNMAEQYEAKAAELLRNKGDSAEIKTLLNSAVEQYQRSIELDNTNLQNQYSLSFTYENLNKVEGDNNQRIKNQEILLRLRKQAFTLTNDPTIKYNLVLAYLDLSFYQLINEQYKISSELVERATALSPHSDWVKVNTALCYFFDNKSVAATSIYKEIRKKNNIDSLKERHLRQIEFLKKSGVEKEFLDRIPELIFGEQVFAQRMLTKAEKLKFIGDSFKSVKDSAEAKNYYNQSIELYQYLIKRDKTLYYSYSYTFLLVNYASVEDGLPAKITLYREIVKIRKKVINAYQRDKEANKQFAFANSYLAWLLSCNNEFAESYQYASAGYKAFPANTSTTKQYIISLLANNHLNTAKALAILYKDLPCNDSTFKQALFDDFDTLQNYEATHDNFLIMKDLLNSIDLWEKEASQYNSLGMIALHRNDTTGEAKAYFESSIDLYSKLMTINKNILYLFSQSFSYENLNAVETDLNKKIKKQEIVIKLREKVYKKYENNANVRINLASAYNTMGWYLLLNKKYSAALKYTWKAKKMKVDNPLIDINLALCYIFTEKLEEAVKIIDAYKDVKIKNDTYRDVFLNKLQKFEEAEFYIPNLQKIRDVLND